MTKINFTTCLDLQLLQTHNENESKHSFLKIGYS